MKEDTRNLVTPKEAEKMVCPHDIPWCFGPNCMAWRWSDKFSAPEPGANYERLGYCGLVGKQCP